MNGERHEYKHRDETMMLVTVEYTGRNPPRIQLRVERERFCCNTLDACAR